MFMFIFYKHNKLNFGSDTDDTELDEESFTSIISKIDEEPVASKPVLASTSASFKTPTKRSARLAKQSK